jgi:acylphosphatase
MDAHVYITVHGMVQGVGFRYFVLREAQQLNLNGYVENLPSGNVGIEAEGDKGILEEFIRIVRVGSRFAEIDDLTTEWKKFEGLYHSFVIRL